MKILIKAVAGSHLFGTNTEKSDHDYKGVFLPTKRELLLGEYKDSISHSTGDDFSRNTKADIDTELYSVRKFFKMLRNGDTAALELLFTPDEMIIEKSPEWDFIVSKRAELLSSKVNALIGYARQQANKYGIKGSRMGELSKVIELLKSLEKEFDFPNAKLKHNWDRITAEIKNFDHVHLIKLPVKYNDEMDGMPALDILGKKFDYHTQFSTVLETMKKIYKNYGQRAREAKKNNGIDWKALSHAVRVCLQGIELMSTERISLPHKKENIDLLLNIKLGKIDYKEVAEIIESKLEELELVTKTSNLPEDIDKDFVDDLVAEIHRGYLFENL